MSTHPQDRCVRGFTIIEVMVGLAIIGVLAAMAIPVMNQWSSDARVRAASHSLARAFTLARTEAIRTGDNHIVFFQLDTQDNSIADSFGVPIVVINDDRAPASNCLIDGGDTVGLIPGERDVNWGVSDAVSDRVPTDFGTGAISTGSSFTDGVGVATTWVSFNSQGMPSEFSTACAVEAAGTGAGATYVSNGRRDYAVVLSPLGSVRIHRWDSNTDAWTN